MHVGNYTAFLRTGGPENFGFPDCVFRLTPFRNFLTRATNGLLQSRTRFGMQEGTEGTESADQAGGGLRCLEVGVDWNGNG